MGFLANLCALVMVFAGLRILGIILAYIATPRGTNAR